ncbi:MAG: preprotein translocase subunit SecG [Nitrospiraceae bacterium]|jgi:preprotein translocase subunit SecG|nr:preprotein translocase subunit SecG [Nitrospiraceae bacterium]
MEVLLLVIHVVSALFLISVVLLQRGKGAEMGAAFGGSSQTLFGSRGPADFLNKLTTAAAVVFMLSSLLLTVVTSKSGSVMDKAQIPTQQQQAAPQLPQQPIQQAPVQPQGK